MAGRPSLYTPEITERICLALIDGQSLRKICQADDMPDKATVMRWLDSHEDFATKYARAREFQADFMDDLILETADACTPESAQADRVRIAAYQWRASKLSPKKYGDKITQEHQGANGGPMVIEIVRFSDSTAE